MNKHFNYHKICRWGSVLMSSLAAENALEIIKCHRAHVLKYPGRCFTTLCLVSLHHTHTSSLLSLDAVCALSFCFLPHPLFFFFYLSYPTVTLTAAVFILSTSVPWNCWHLNLCFSPGIGELEPLQLPSDLYVVVIWFNFFFFSVINKSSMWSFKPTSLRTHCFCLPS